MSKEEIKLTEDQIDSLVNFWTEREDNPPSRKELISYVFPDIEDSLVEELDSLLADTPSDNFIHIWKEFYVNKGDEEIDFGLLEKTVNKHINQNTRNREMNFMCSRIS